ncbi:MAG: hypothetical protein HGA54_02330 [Actinobacteria bacterium]|nr:hypothetical protein [Actinomycetota bacterium]
MLWQTPQQTFDTGYYPASKPAQKENEGVLSMSFVPVLIITIITVIVLQPVLRKQPVVFYALALMLDVVLFASTVISFPHPVDQTLILSMRRAFLPLALFVIVMFTGVFGRTSRIRALLQPIRGYLSVIACLLMVGHVVSYFLPYVSGLLKGLLPISVAVAIITGILLTLFVVVLGATSFDFIKMRMSRDSWRSVQKCSYAFFFLIYTHIALLIGTAVIYGRSTVISGSTSTSAFSNILVYTGLFAFYAILRLARNMIDRKSQKQIARL